MNRKQRRDMERQLGITKKRQSLTTSQKIKENSKNIQSGKKKDEEMKEARRLQENEATDKALQARISSLATTLMVKHQIEWYQALKAAKQEIEAE